MARLTGWEIDKSAQSSLALGKADAIRKFIRAFGPLAVVDPELSFLVVLRRYHPELNCSPDDPPYKSDDFSIGLGLYTAMSYSYCRLPKSLTYQSVTLERSAVPSTGMAVFDILITTAEFGSTRTNVAELMTKIPTHTMEQSEASRLSGFRALINERPKPIKKIPITSTHITLDLIGMLTPSDFADWWTATAMIPFFGQRRPVTLMAFNPQDPAHAPRLEKADAAITLFLNRTAADRRAAGRTVVKNCHNFIESVGEQDWNTAMAQCDPDKIWTFVHPRNVYLEYHEKSRRMNIVLARECDWEEEHGLQLVYRDGTTLVRMSERDGHLLQ